MRTSTLSKNTSPSGARRVLLATALSVPLSALLLSGSALAAGPDSAGAPGKSGAAAAGQPAARDAAPGQEDKDKGKAAPSSAPASSAPAEPEKEQPAKPQAEKKAEPAKTAEPAPKAQPSKKAEPAPQAAPSQPGSSNGTSGSTSSPQPLSNADKNGTGANPGASCTGAYCSTRNGSPSANGNGGGAAGGKPCAGCVGRADNKNPRGQAPGGSDRNNGYECDGNKGIGKGNPAHTGCTPGTEVLPEKPGKPAKPETPGKPAKPGKPGTPTTPATPDRPETCVAAGSSDDDCTPVTPPASCVAGDAAGPQASGCPVTPGTTSSTDGGVLSNALIPGALRPSIVPLSAVAPQALTLSPRSAVAAAATPSALPFTGADLAMLLPLSLIALAFGIALVALGRTRTADQE